MLHFSTSHKMFKLLLVRPSPPGLHPPLLTHLWSPGTIKPKQHAADQSVVKGTVATTVTVWWTEYLYTGYVMTSTPRRTHLKQNNQHLLKVT